MRKTVYTIVAMLAVVSVAQAGLVVDAGNWNLLPNQAGQQISVTISGSGNVTNATLVMEIIGSSSKPIFTDGDIISGTIFASNNTDAPVYDFIGSLAYLDIATLTGTTSVNDNLLLANIIVSTVGITSGTYALKLTGTQWGDTLVGTDPVTSVSYLEGSINVVPEPVSLVLLLIGGILARRQKVKI